MIFYSIIIIFVLLLISWRFLSTAYSLPCPTWLSWMVEMDNPFTKTNRASNIISNLDIKPGMFVLDVGCGPGRLTIPLAQKIGSSGKVFALDIQEGMLKKVQKKADKENLNNIVFIKSEIGEGVLENNKFDKVVLVTVLGEIVNQEKALKEIFNAIKPGGVLSVTEIIFDPHFQRKGKVLDLASKVGFKEKQFFGNKMAYTLHLEKPIKTF